MTKLLKEIRNSWFGVFVVLCGMIGVWICVYSITTVYVERYVAKEQVVYNVLIEGVKHSEYRAVKWIGSGVIINSDGLILTAGHCVKDADYIKVTLNDGRSFKVTSYYESQTSDVGLIKIDANDLPAVEFGDSDDLKKGMHVYNIGASEGIWDNDIIHGKVWKNDFKRLAFNKILEVDTEYIFCNYGAYPGDSGGGLYYKNLMVGIVAMGGDGLSWSVPTIEINKVLRKYGKQKMLISLD